MRDTERQDGEGKKSEKTEMGLREKRFITLGRICLSLLTHCFSLTTFISSLNNVSVPFAMRKIGIK